MRLRAERERLAAGVIIILTLRLQPDVNCFQWDDMGVLNKEI